MIENIQNYAECIKYYLSEFPKKQKLRHSNHTSVLADHTSSGHGQLNTDMVTVIDMKLFYYAITKHLRDILKISKQLYTKQIKVLINVS